MSTVNLPASFIPSVCSFKEAVTQRVGASPFAGSEQAIDLLNDRWLCSVTIPMRSWTEGAEMEALIASFRGQTNVVELYHFVRPAPRGTIRGTLTLSASAVQGASSIVVTGCEPSTGTFKAGDMLGVSGLLLMVQSDCTAVAGVVTVPITNRLRTALAADAVVDWDKPTATFRLLATSGVIYSGAIIEDTTFDFGEKI